MNDSILGERLRLSLRYSGVMQKELAAELGVTNNTVSYWCSGKRTPNVRQLVQISQYLDVTTDYLFGLSEHPFRSEEKVADQTVKELKRIREQFLVPYTAIEDLIRFINGASKSERPEIAKEYFDGI